MYLHYTGTLAWKCCLFTNNAQRLPTKLDDILGQGNLNLVSEKSGKSQGILLSIICGNPELLMEQFDTFTIQCRHIEHMHEGV